MTSCHKLVGVGAELGALYRLCSVDERARDALSFIRLVWVEVPLVVRRVDRIGFLLHSMVVVVVGTGAPRRYSRCVQLTDIDTSDVSSRQCRRLVVVLGYVPHVVTAVRWPELILSHRHELVRLEFRSACSWPNCHLVHPK